MRRNDPDNLDFDAASITVNHCQERSYCDVRGETPVAFQGGQHNVPEPSVHELGLTAPPQRPSLEEGLSVPVPSEVQEIRRNPEAESSAVHSKEDVVPYNLRNRPAPYEVPSRKPGLQGLGCQPNKSLNDKLITLSVILSIS